MCGIAGLVGGPLGRADKATVVSRMIDALRLRGPDDFGMMVTDRIAFGMRRLSIIDIEGGHQPISNEDKSVHVIQNGEIYNYRELRALLKMSGHEFRTGSDTEVLVHGYEEWGAELPSRLRGMYAFAVHNERGGETLLAVDRLGVKPLYFAETPHGVFFGSELKSVLASQLVAREIDWEALALYLHYGHVPPPHSIYLGIKKLMPGWQVLISKEGVRFQQYWDLPEHSVTPFERGAAATSFREHLADAVTSQLVSDVPVGAFLSGGLDSSSVVALAASSLKSELKTFTVGFPVKEFDERDLARQVAQRYGTEHHEVVVEPESIDVLPTLLAYFDEPFADSSAVPTYFVCKLARQFVKVALSGDGGDETLLGYNYFKSTQLASRIAALPSGMRRAARAILENSPGAPGRTMNRHWSLFKKRASDCLRDPLDCFCTKQFNVQPETLERLLHPDAAERIAKWNVTSPIVHLVESRQVCNKDDDLERYGYAALKFSLPSDMLVKVDRMSMMNSLEVRVPMLDHHLVQFVSAISVRERLRIGQSKALLRSAMSRLLPADVLSAKKRGFSMPVSRWFASGASAFLHDVVSSAANGGFFSGPAVENLHNEIRDGREVLSPALWTVIALEIWRQNSGMQLN